MKVLGIESSCDETAAAIYDTQHGLLAHTVHSQTTTHADFGGVVPELASRDHLQHLLPIIQHTLANAECTLNDIEGIAYTKGPGLAGALLVGTAGAKALAFALQKPVIGIHHLEGHLLAACLENAALTFPFLVLLVSGGHTELITVHALGEYRILGETIDDAAGEAFDKTAKILGLGYPGGAKLADLATQGRKGVYTFTRPMPAGLNFSFSGLKTQAMQLYNKEKQKQADTELSIQQKADIACAFEDTMVDTLSAKAMRALQQSGLSCLVISGGVGANQALRQRLQQLSTTSNFTLYYPKTEFCTDNAAMIAYAGALRLMRGEQEDSSIHVLPRWNIDQLFSSTPLTQ